MFKREVKNLENFSPPQGQFIALQLLRVLLGSAVTFYFYNLIEPGVALPFLVLSSTLGIVICGSLLKRNLSFIKIAFVHICLLILTKFALIIADNILGNYFSSLSSDFLLSTIAQSLTLLSILYILAFLSTWIFWKSYHTVTIEVVLFSIFIVYILRSHRNYQIDSPQKISEVSWQYGIEPHHLLLTIAVSCTILLITYLLLASSRALFAIRNAKYNKAKPHIFGTTLILLLAFSFIGGYSLYLNEKFTADLSRAQNGVGQTNQEGDSPLGFHSAVGKTKQPAALVRLESDYNANPLKPMLYLREGALSQFNGKELVLASAAFDGDVPRIVPGQEYLGLNEELPKNREKLVHSVYLLTKHKTPFAIDSPNAIRGIKNPDPTRFQATYQALSYALTIDLKQIIGEEVGDANWDEQTLQHYLRAPASQSRQDINPEEELSAPIPDDHGEDSRYKILSKKLLVDIEAPILKASAIINFLSKNSLYTRQPGHQVATNGDPVASYLFSKDMRGYCVHFAHAAVYLMRLAGIPSRIATGYLTDTSYAKDGHILLHLGDRHAWPEIYVRGIGWVVFDITPEKAENEQMIVPDPSLLEELITKIDPAQEFLEPQRETPSDTRRHKSTLFNISKQTLYSLLIFFAASWILLKFILRYRYLFALDPRKRIKLAYACSSASLLDLGLGRDSGETRLEYANRVKNLKNIDSTILAELTQEACYRNERMDRRSDLNSALDQFTNSYRLSYSKFKRVLGFLSPFSIFRIFNY